MAPAIVERTPDIPDPKRQKLEDDEPELSYDDENEHSDEDDSELSYDDEDYERSGEYDFDFSRVRYPVGFRPVILEECHFADEPETDRDLIGKMCITALKKYNEDEKTCFEFVTAIRANWNLAAGIAFSISLEAKDTSTNRIVPFHARVRYFDWCVESWCPFRITSSSQEEVDS